MIKKNRWVLIVIALVVIILGASFLYNILLEDYDNTKEMSDDRNLAPDFAVVDYDGNEVRLSDFKGKPVVLNFWATWCYYCKEEMPDFDRAFAEYPEVQFMMVNATDGIQETLEGAKSYIDNEGYAFDVFFDTELEAVGNYYVSGFPATFFIDADGNVVAQANGMIDYETLDKWIKITMEE